MPDSKQTTSPHDSTRVSLSVESEVQYWTHKFGVSEAELKKAVRAVGHHASEVEKYLQNKKL